MSVSHQAGTALSGDNASPALTTAAECEQLKLLLLDAEAKKMVAAEKAHTTHRNLCGGDGRVGPCAGPATLWQPGLHQPAWLE